MQRILLWSVGLWLAAGSVQAQDSLDVPFRYLGAELAQVPDRVFLPGQFNGWGQPYLPGTPSCIQKGHPSQMVYQRRERFWQLPVRLRIGSTVQYKIQTQLGDGSTCEWRSDPLNPDVATSDNNSVLTVTDPLLFQVAEEPSASGNMRAISAGLAGTEAFTSIAFAVNGVERTDGLDFFDAATGVFRFELEREVRLGAEIRITATDAQGREVTATQGEIIPPIDWLTPEYATVTESAVVRASVTRLDGTIDASLTEATLQVNGTPQTVAVAMGQVEAEVALERGANTLVLEATVEGQTFTSAPLTLTGRIHPLNLQLISATVVPQQAGQILVSWSRTELGAGATIEAAVDAAMSTVPVANISITDNNVTATATPFDRRGEVYIDVVATTPDGLRDPVRIAVIVGPNGQTRQMRYEENAEWTKRAVVYEIFPLTFGPISSGSFANPSPRLQQITAELDYIAEMGFTTIWFMPIMYNQFMDPLSGGYNIRDFYRVDPRIGTNDDFKVLVARAHELGLRVILDITPNHVSPIHPWVESLRDGGPFAEYVQTQPDPHNQGLDGRGPNLTEIWQVEGGENLYRKYDGFGDLANLDWDNDDLQAEFLNILKFWVDEFNIDGWRFDVYWGPWRRYGPDRFGRPIRELMKRIKPDQWLLGENAGTGSSTEVYFADDDNGNSVVGGLDAAYDWNFYFNGILGAYGSPSRYDQ
ncbi:MAG: alpha-amylase family glycosyl hydrolase, partial [Bacteroidota bacterium]